MASTKDDQVNSNLCDSCGTPLICPKCDKGETVAASRAGVLTLSSVPRDGRGQFDFDKLLLCDTDLVSGQVVRELLTDVLIQETLRSGRLTPAMIPNLRPLALSDRAAFRSLVGSLPISIDFRERGHGGEGLMDKDRAQVWADRRAKEISNDKGVPYSEAFKMALSENRAVAEELFA